MEKSVVKFDEDSGLDFVEEKCEIVGFSIIGDEDNTRIQLELSIELKINKR